MGNLPTLGGEERVYPRSVEGLPLARREGRYRVDFARSAEELDRVQALRFEVFNVELGEGLDESWAERRDRDPFDDQCHHLMILDAESDELVGTYRIQTPEMALAGVGLYCASEFDLSRVPAEVVAESIELGRACIARGHRNGQALFALWRGLAAYVAHNRRRYLFGCCSLTSQDPQDGVCLDAYLRRAGYGHPDVRVEPLPGLECEGEPTADRPAVEIPTLFGTYLRYGAKVCGPPAIDRRFKTIDFLVLIDVEALARRLRRLFFEDLEPAG